MLVPADAHQTIALVRMNRAATRSAHRTPGGAFRPGHGVRSRIPKQEHPHAIEASFAAAIISHVVGVLRDVMKPIVEALPHLLGDDRDDAADVEHPTLTARAFRFRAGLPIVIENDKGTTREWTDGDGTTGSTTMKHAYGYIAGTLGADGEDVDVYVGQVLEPRQVHVVDQMSKADGFASFDEHKVMIGYASADAAKAAYLEQYDDPRFFGGMTSMSIADFRKQLGTPQLSPRTDRMDADTPQIRRMFDRARAELEKRALNGTRLDDLSSRYGHAASEFQRVQLARQVKSALGIDLMAADRSVPGLLQSFTHESVARIRSMAEYNLSDMERMVAHAVGHGQTSSDLGEDIEARYGVSERSARFIARDQIGTVTGQVNAARQQAIGIRRFTWRTVGDERVREEHEELNGEVFDFDDPPATIGLPGEDYNCRCSAEPVFSDILDAVRDNE